MIEIGVRKTIAQVNELHSGMRFMCLSKSEGVVAVEFKPLVSIVAHIPTHVVMKWNSLVADQHGIDRQAVQAEFESNLGAGAEVQWS